MENTTPMMRQYLEIKKQYPGTILFFRLGDFYEMFNEDAIIGSRELEITLTARQKDSPRPIPMCGVPHHAASNYIARLVKKGYRVAICDQAEIATKDIKLVKREVVRVITPGTAIDSQLIESKENIFLAAMCGSGESFGISYLDLSTGEFFATQISGNDAWQKTCSDIESFAPRELLFPKSLEQLVANTFNNSSSLTLSDASKFSTSLTSIDDWQFHLEDATNLLKKQFNVLELTGFGLQNKNEAIRAASACLRYAQETQRATAEHIAEINYFEANDFMVLDAVTLRNLDITDSPSAHKRSLLNVIDSTVTGMGARLLKSWLLRPSIKRSEIQTRLSAVSELTDSILRDKIRYLLKEISDLERLVGRLNLGTCSPRDLLALNRSLSQTPNINLTLSDAKSLLIQVLSENIFELPEIRSLITSSISDEPPMNVADGGVIRQGFNVELDELRSVSNDAKKIIAVFEEQEKQRTGIATLKVKFNNVFGYFIEVSKGQTSRVPTDYERRQTLSNAERYTTPQLKEWEEKVLGAEEKIIEIEAELFKQIRAEVQKETRNLQSTARALATLDALCSLAETATKRNYVPPILHDGDEIEIKDGRHPMVEAFSTNTFIPNDLTMNNSTDRLLIITGPNMGGKCLSGETIVFTDEGLKKLSDLRPTNSPENKFTAIKKNRLKTRLGYENATHFYTGGIQKTLKLKTRFGYEIEGTKDHKIWVRHKNGEEKWIYFDELLVGDVVAIERNINVWGNKTTIEPFEFKFNTNAKHFKIPTEIGEDLGYLLGLLVGDGSGTYKETFTLTTKDLSIADDFKRIISALFGCEVKYNASHLAYRVHGKQIRSFLNHIGFGYEKSELKSVPKIIFSSPKKVVIAFLQGLFDTDGYAANRQAKVFLTSTSKLLVQEIQMLLLNFGIVSSIKPKPTKCLTAYNLSIYGADAITFHEKIGFRLERKKVRQNLASVLRMPNVGIPHLFDTLKTVQNQLVTSDTKPVALKNDKKISSIFYTYLPNNRNISYKKLDELIEFCHSRNVVNFEIETIQMQNYFYDKIVEIKESESEVFDLSIENDHSYIANGFVSHNSTNLRQVALIQILAQIGSFVPAKSAKLPILDRIWTRVGASDDLASGRSTFMVEMTETATILHNSTPRSLILLDEIGRGTSTFDGLSIAWAVAEYLHDSPEHSAKTLFATHYHELTELAETLVGAKNYQITATEKDGEVVFLHKLEKGKANKSYGIAVAQLAGLPQKTIARAKEVLEKLEKYELAVFATEKKGLDKVARKQIASQFSLFAISNENVVDEIRDMELDKISDSDAKSLLAEMQRKII